MSALEANFGIEAAAYYLPMPRRELHDWGRDNDVAASVVSALQANGMHYFHQAATESVEDLAVKAIEALALRAHFNPDQVDLLIFVHSLQTSTPAPPASLPARLKARFHLRRACAFALADQNCASLLVALRMLNLIYASEPGLCKVLLVSADRCCAEIYRNVGTFSFESDGACALLLSREAPHNRVACVINHVDGRHYAGHQRPASLIKDYRAMYGVTALMLIKRAARQAGFSIGEFRRLVPINLDRNIFNRMAKVLSMDPSWIYTRNIAAHGHVLCSDIVINLCDMWAQGELHPGDKLLFFVSGNSGSFATMAMLDCHPVG